MDGLKIGQVVVFQVNTDAEKETSVSAVHNLKVSELKECSTECSVCMYTHELLAMYGTLVCSDSPQRNLYASSP